MQDARKRAPADRIRAYAVLASGHDHTVQPMGELYDDRRQEPRFTAGGFYHLREGARSGPGRIYDLSLNGAMLERVDGQPLAPTERKHIVISFPGQPDFVADVLVQHIAGDRVGVEFYDMSPEHFSTLAGLIERFVRSR